MTLLHRLVIPGIGSTFAPGDPDTLPETDFVITSKPGVNPWIAQEGEGPDAVPAITGDGQRLNPLSGQVEDGGYEARVIDEPGLIAVCGLSTIVPEGDADLNLGSSAFTAGANMWHRHEVVTGSGAGTSDDGVPPVGIALKAQIIGGHPGFGGFILFASSGYNGYIWRVFDGTEGGGAGFVPGNRYGFRCRVTWSLDSGPGNLFIETIGGTDPVTGLSTNRVSVPSAGYDFWHFDPLLSAIVFNGYVSAVADGSGQIEFRFGAENYGGSCNVTATISDMEIVECGYTTGGTDLYVTGWLADDDARQQLSGRLAYLEESTDSGATWSRVLYTGYVQPIVMEESKTYLFRLGDAGRGRRVSKAWRDLNPIEDFTP